MFLCLRPFTERQQNNIKLDLLRQQHVPYAHAITEAGMLRANSAKCRSDETYMMYWGAPLVMHYT